MNAARVVLSCSLAAWFLAILATPASAQVRRGGAPLLPDDPSEVIQTLHGFKLELVLRSDPQKHGSWISVGKDDKGRLLLGGQRNQPLTRLTLENGKVLKEEVLKLPVSEVMGILWLNDALYLNGAAQLPSDGEAAPARGGRPAAIYGLYRLRDPAGDGSFSSIERLRTWQNGAGEHGAHAILLSPDKKHLIVLVGNAVGQPPETSPMSPMRNFADDRAIPRREGGFMAGEKPPGGSIFRMDLDGKNIERIAAGQRNAYDIAMDAEGEIFGYDSDMEWDWGLPWYRPTRVFHATSGADSGYRGGSGKLPTYYEDTLPATVDIGIGSPTGVEFGHGAKFPARYQNALYIMDWSYGRLIAVHLQPWGSSYEATWENFVAPKSLHRLGQKVPLNVTDMVIGDDGAMYFACGGRNTQGYLLRVTYTGGENTDRVENRNKEGAEARALRRRLESFHREPNPQAIEVAWPHLGSDDRFLRFAARLAIEAQPVIQWKSRALDQANSPQAAIEALLALARVGGKEHAADVYAALARIPMAALGEDLRLQKLRALQVAISRNGKPDGEIAAATLADLDVMFPSHSPELNAELSQVLLALDAPQAVARTMGRVKSARLMEEQIAYLLLLRQVRNGWTPELRREFFSWFNNDRSQARRSESLLRWFDEAGRAYANGNEFNLYLSNIRYEALAVLSDEEKQEPGLAAILAAHVPVPRSGRGGPQAAPPAPRPVVKAWTMDDLLPALPEVSRGRNFARAKAAYDAAQCSTCHAIAGAATGGIGPDLTSIASRFQRLDMLESILEPSKVISEQFASTIIRLRNRDAVEGQVVEETADNVVVQLNPLRPEKVTIRKSDITVRGPSPLSPMPTSLVDTLTKDEILDLIAYLEAAGNPEHPDFKSQ